MSSHSHISLITLSIFTLLLSLTAEAQTSSCAQSLVPCANFLNSTNPPSSCCVPLKDAVKNQLKCLCDLYNTPGFLKSLGININDALLLSERCKTSGDLNSCVKASGPASPSPQTPPASPGKDKNGVSKIAGTGMLSIISIWAYVMFC